MRRTLGWVVNVFRRRYLHPWTDLHRPPTLNRAAFPHDPNQPIPEPQPCQDISLKALTQLGALRLNARTCLVTLVTLNNEYVLAESSRSLKPDLWIGTCHFPRDQGITALALTGWRKARRCRGPPPGGDHYYTAGRSPHWCIVNDMRNDDEYRDQVFVKRGGPRHRFYFSVPLRDFYGSVLGSLTILDDKPRYGVSAEEMSAMEDIADGISDHLDASLVRAQRQRSEKLIQALGLFNTGKDTLREWWLAQDDARLMKDNKYNINLISAQDQQDRVDHEFGKQQSPEHVGTKSSPRSVFSEPRIPQGPSEYFHLQICLNYQILTN